MLPHDTTRTTSIQPVQRQQRNIRTNADTDRRARTQTLMEVDLHKAFGGVLAIATELISFVGLKERLDMAQLFFLALARRRRRRGLRRLATRTLGRHHDLRQISHGHQPPPQHATARSAELGVLVVADQLGASTKAASRVRRSRSQRRPRTYLVRRPAGPSPRLARSRPRCFRAI